MVVSQDIVYPLFELLGQCLNLGILQRLVRDLAFVISAFWGGVRLVGEVVVNLSSYHYQRIIYKLVN